MGISKFSSKRNRVFLLLIGWLVVGVFISAFHPFGLYILMPLIPCCIILFILSFFVDIRKLSLLVVIIVIILIIVLVPIFFVFKAVIKLFFHLAIISYIIITAIFGLYACYKGGTKLDKALYNVKSPFNHFLRLIEFFGGIFLGLYIIYWIFIFTGAKLFFITWILIITILVIAIISLILLLFGKFNAWLGTFSIYAAIYFAYLIIVFIYASIIYDRTGAAPIIIKLIIATFDVLILIYTTIILVGKRADIISKKLKFIKSETILFWLILCKASYEIAIIQDPFLSSIKNQYVLFIFVALLGIVGIYGIIKYKKYRKNK